jgi:hypothetical protein
MKRINVSKVKLGDIIYDVPGGLKKIASGKVIENNAEDNRGGGRITIVQNKLDEYDKDLGNWWFNDPITILDPDDIDLLILKQ